ncbi:MAG: imidazoleglycerol-phosphate dehydratase [Candidatus Omnitrophica bacterium]|nr:imidazoleglycerol-phosphate dehydratase [Candidatus Omnitrophota bacterium]
MRKAEIKRKTEEVDIQGGIVIDAEGKDVKGVIDTSIDFLNHLFTVFAFHGLLQLTLESKGDLKHHLLEDIGIGLGKSFKEALGDCSGIRRFGYSYVVMETALVRAVIDISGRSFYKRDSLYNARVLPALDFSDTDNISWKDVDEFMKAFSENAKLNIHLSYTYYSEQDGKGNAHHLLEAIFKAVGIALDQATQIDPRRKRIPSSKGVID